MSNLSPQARRKLASILAEKAKTPTLAPKTAVVQTVKPEVANIVPQPFPFKATANTLAPLTHNAGAAIDPTKNTAKPFGFLRSRLK